MISHLEPHIIVPRVNRQRILRMPLAYTDFCYLVIVVDVGSQILSSYSVTTKWCLAEKQSRAIIRDLNNFLFK